MYCDHFGFTETPFSITPDPKFFLFENSHRNALTTLLVALDHCEGFIKVVGEVGTGKTLLSRVLLNCLKDNFVTVDIANPYLTPEELKQLIADKIGARPRKRMAAHELLSSLHQRLIQLQDSGKRVVVVIDEAQAMPRDTVESLRLLTNLETEKYKLLQVVLFGQPELDKRLDQPDLRQLKQRIVFSERLKPLDSRACNDYIQHRLNAVRGSTPVRFSPIARALISWASRGIPRLINILAHKALICAYGRGHSNISAWHAAKAIVDTTETKAALQWLAQVLACDSFGTAKRKSV